MIVRTAHLFRGQIAEATRRIGVELTAEETTILLLLSHRSHPGRMGDIAGELMRDATTLKRQIDGLVRRGLVERTSAENDRRAVLIGLTEEGRHLSCKVSPEWNRLRERILRDIDPSDVDTFLTTLLRMQSNMMHVDDRPAVDRINVT